MLNTDNANEKGNGKCCVPDCDANAALEHGPVYGQYCEAHAWEKYDADRTAQPTQSAPRRKQGRAHKGFAHRNWPGAR